MKMSLSFNRQAARIPVYVVLRKLHRKEAMTRLRQHQTNKCQAIYHTARTLKTAHSDDQTGGMGEWTVQSLQHKIILSTVQYSIHTYTLT